MEVRTPAARLAEGAAPHARSRQQRWYWSLFGVSALGALDTGQFLATNLSMFRVSPGRAAGSVLGLALWVTLAGLSASTASGHRSSALARAILPLSGLLAAGSLALVAVHSAARVGGLRPALGGALGLAALGLAYLANRD